MTYGAYGDGTGRNAELCGVGEMWGYSMGARQAYEKYGTDPKVPFLNQVWICPEIFWNLMKSDILTKKQIFDCLTSDVKTYNSLVERMYANYPEKADFIEKAFNDSNIYPDVTKPQVCNLENQTVSSSMTVTGQNIILQNISVKNSATLTLKSENSIIINEPFFVERDSNFILTRQ